jgi:hypothetical protein
MFESLKKYKITSNYQHNYNDKKTYSYNNLKRNRSSSTLSSSTSTLNNNGIDSILLLIKYLILIVFIFIAFSFLNFYLTKLKRVQLVHSNERHDFIYIKNYGLSVDESNDSFNSNNILQILSKKYHQKSKVESNDSNSCNYMKYDKWSSGQNEYADLGDMCDLTVTVKTTKNNHDSKIKTILDTWFKLAPSRVYFVTDQKDDEFSKLTSNFKLSHIV